MPINRANPSDYKLPENYGWNKEIIKWVVSLSTGALIIFLTFSKALKLLYRGENMLWIGLPLLALAVTAASGVLSLIFLTQFANRLERLERDELISRRYRMPEEKREEIKKSQEDNLKHTNYLYETMIYSFFASIIFLSIFAANQLHVIQFRDKLIEKVTVLPKDTPILVEYKNDSQEVVIYKLMKSDTLLNNDGSMVKVIYLDERDTPK